MGGSEAGYAGERLAEFVVGTGWQALPAAIRHQGKRALLNYVACALAVAEAPTVAALAALLAEYSGPPAAGLIGRAERLDAPSAAFVNAVAANLLDYDDTHLATVIHPTAPVAAPVLALAEARAASGAEALLALALGCEVECRLGNAVSPGHYARGWHITATCGVFGAAAASARLLGLSASQTWHALGIAASQSAGLVENLPSGAKNVGVGNAARNGLFAALLAQRGFTAAPAAIEGPRGWARAMGDAPDLEALTGGLGRRWAFAENTYKPYPCGIVMHAIIDACLQLRAEHSLAAEEIRRVTVAGDALLLARGDRDVANERDARVSLHHAAAAPLLWGRAGLAEFSEAMAMSAAAVSFRAKVVAERDDGLTPAAARVAVETDRGRFEATVLHARGSMEAPLADAELEAKARELAPPGLDVERLIAAVWGLDEGADAGELARLAVAGADGRPPSRA